MSNDIERQVDTALAALLVECEKAQCERDHAIEALQEAKKQLEHMHKSKSEFVSVISHEFRSVLTTIQGFSEMMCQRDLSVAEMKEFAVDIYQDAQHLSRVINDMLETERIDMECMQLRYGWLDLNAVIMEIVNHMQLTAGQHTIHVKLANALPVLMGDAEKLAYVIENLLDNALKYSHEDGDVYISSAVEGSVVHVCVQDNGIGIPAESINRIFEPYERVETNINKSIPGLGLGLAHVCQIVRMHGGQVWAESILDEGSRFHFTVQFVKRPMNILGLLS